MIEEQQEENEQEFPELELTFGIPSSGSNGGDKYPDTPYLIIKADLGKGKTKKFELNKKAVEVLGLENGPATVGVSFHNDKVVIANTTGLSGPFFSVTKGKPRSFSNAKMYSYISKFLILDNSSDVEVELAFGEATYNNQKVLYVVNDKDMILKNSSQDSEGLETLSNGQEVTQEMETEIIHTSELLGTPSPDMTTGDQMSMSPETADTVSEPEGQDLPF